MRLHIASVASTSRRLEAHIVTSKHVLRDQTEGGGRDGGHKLVAERDAVTERPFGLGLDDVLSARGRDYPLPAYTKFTRRLGPVSSLSRFSLPLLDGP